MKHFLNNTLLSYPFQSEKSELIIDKFVNQSGDRRIVVYDNSTVFFYHNKNEAKPIELNLPYDKKTHTVSNIETDSRDSQIAFVITPIAGHRAGNSKIVLWNIATWEMSNTPEFNELELPAVEFTDRSKLDVAFLNKGKQLAVLRFNHMVKALYKINLVDSNPTEKFFEYYYPDTKSIKYDDKVFSGDNRYCVVGAENSACYSYFAVSDNAEKIEKKMKNSKYESYLDAEDTKKSIESFEESVIETFGEEHEIITMCVAFGNRNAEFNNGAIAEIGGYKLFKDGEHFSGEYVGQRIRVDFRNIYRYNKNEFDSFCLDLKLKEVQNISAKFAPSNNLLLLSYLYKSTDKKKAGLLLDVVEINVKTKNHRFLAKGETVKSVSCTSSFAFSKNGSFVRYTIPGQTPREVIASLAADDDIEEREEYLRKNYLENSQIDAVTIRLSHISLFINKTFFARPIKRADNYNKLRTSIKEDNEHIKENTNRCRAECKML